MQNLMQRLIEKHNTEDGMLSKPVPTIIEVPQRGRVVIKTTQGQIVVDATGENTHVTADSFPGFTISGSRTQDLLISEAV